MSQLELYISKRHTWACGAVIFLAYGNACGARFLKKLHVRLRRNFYDLRCPSLDLILKTISSLTNNLKKLI